MPIITVRSPRTMPGRSVAFSPQYAYKLFKTNSYIRLLPDCYSAIEFQEFCVLKRLYSGPSRPRRGIAQRRSGDHPDSSRARSTGIVFVRTDLDRFPIPASWRHVARVSYATSLMRQGVLISTTEHLFSVFYSMGIDKPTWKSTTWRCPSWTAAGSLRRDDPPRRRQDLPAQAPLPAHPAPGDRGRQGQAHLDSAGGQFPLSCDVFFGHPLVGRQTLEMEVTPERYAAEIAPARTFGFAYELDQMRNMGLIRGASLENAVCFDRERA